MEFSCFTRSHQARKQWLSRGGVLSPPRLNLTSDRVVGKAGRWKRCRLIVTLLSRRYLVRNNVIPSEEAGKALYLPNVTAMVSRIITPTFLHRYLVFFVTLGLTNQIHHLTHPQPQTPT